MDRLEAISIKNPCPAEWDEMDGDERSRFCKLCKLNVYNISAMTREEAGAFIAQSEGRVCGRFYQRPDGTVLTKDCSVARVSRARRMAAVALVLAVLFTIQGAVALSGFSYRDVDFNKLRNSYVCQFKAIRGAVDWAENTLTPPRLIMGDFF